LQGGFRIRVPAQQLGKRYFLLQFIFFRFCNGFF
jgi:hypothetical protein